MNISVHGSLSRRWIAALAMGTVGFGLNGFGLPVFGTSEIVFGGAATLLVTYCLGPWFGGLATALAFSRTWLSWGHPAGLLCFTLEAIVVGWLQHRRNRSPLVATALFWGLVGLPLALLAMLRQPEIPFPNNWADALLFPLNSALMALWVLPVFYSRRFRSALGLPLDREADTPLQRVLFRRLGLIIIPCIATLSLFAGRVLDQSMRSFARTELVADGRELAELLQHHLDRQQRALFLIAGANIANTPGENRLQSRLELLRNLYPGFLRLRAAYLAGRVVAVAPTIPATAFSHGDHGFYYDDARQAMPLDAPAVSAVAHSGPDGRDLVVALSAPLLDATGSRVGVIEGLVDLNDVTTDIGGAGQLEGRTIVIVDQHRRVVASRGRVAPAPLSLFSGSPLYFAARENRDALFTYDHAAQDDRERFIGTRDLVPDYGCQP
ncbi:MAG: cache domain-containing protein, partial [Oleiharenicola lentus]